MAINPAKSENSHFDYEWSEDDVSSSASGPNVEGATQTQMRVRDIIKMYDIQSKINQNTNAINSSTGHISNKNSNNNSNSSNTNVSIGNKNNLTTTTTPRAHSPVTQSQSQHTLASIKSSFCGLNVFGSRTNVRQYVSQLEDATKLETHSLTGSCDAGNTRGRIAEDGNWIRKVPSKSNLSKVIDMNLEQNLNNCINISHYQQENEDYDQENKNILETDINKENDEIVKHDPCNSMCQCYDSKTTIAKTPTGVRIVIDIFFNPDDDVDDNNVIGSRIETSIPNSNILSEFQEKALKFS